MNKDECFIIDRFGKDRHFLTPDNYFVDFHDRIMKVVNEDNCVPLHSGYANRKRIFAVVAACVAVLLVCTGIVLSSNLFGTSPIFASNAAVTEVESNAMDVAADYMMIDNDDVYSYLTYE